MSLPEGLCPRTRLHSRARLRSPARRGPRSRHTPPSQALTLRQAIVLGLLQGPAELLPISSSGHITLVPWLLDWRYAELDAELRKSFEVALHAGTAAALLLSLRDEVGEALRGLDRRRLLLVASSFAPAAIAGLTLERLIERRLGTPASIAAGLLAGSAAMALADLCGSGDRHRDEAGLTDGLWLGLAQACALVPGVSRNGATLAAARARGFNRADANVLSRHCALPVIVGAVVLKGGRLARRRDEFSDRLATGAAAAFVSTLASRWLIGQVERDRSMLPYAAYRGLVALAVIRRLRQNGDR
jgi:undecaprenyl-diphosphatase